LGKNASAETPAPKVTEESEVKHIKEMRTSARQMMIPPFGHNYLSKAYIELMVYPSCPQRSDPKSAAKDNK